MDAIRNDRGFHASVLSLLLLCLLVLLPAALPALELTPEEQRWIADNPTVMVGADANWPPFDFVDSRGNHQGIAASYLQAVSDLSGLNFEVVGSRWNDAIAAVKSGEIAMLACAGITEERREFLDFTAPYAVIDTVIVTEKSSNRVARLEDLAGKTIALPSGTYIHEMLRTRYPEVKLSFVASNEEALNVLSLGKVDAYVGNLAVVSYFIEKNLLGNLNIDARIPDEATAVSVAVRKDQPLLFSIVNKALNSISETEHRHIRREWMQFKKPDASVRALRLTAEERRWLTQHRELRIGVDPQWPPIEYIDELGLYQGIASDYVFLFEELLNVDMRYNPDLSWSEVTEKIRNRELDILPAISITEERKTFLNFTRPYLQFPYVLFTRDDTALITDLSELDGRMVAVEKDYANHNLLRQNHPDIDLLVVSTTREALKAVALGQADAYMGNLAATSHVLLQYGITNIKVAAPTPYSNDLAFAVRKDWPELVTILNKALLSVPPETRNQFKEKWFSVRYQHQVDYGLLWRVLTIAGFFLLLFGIWLYSIRRQREALRLSEERFQLAMEAASEGIWDWDIENDSVTYTEGYFGMLGYEPEDFSDTRKIWTSLLHPDDRKAAVAFVHAQLHKDQARYEHDFRLLHKDGTYRHIHAVGAVVKRDRRHQPTRVVGAQIDITEIKQLQQQLERARDQAENANRIKSSFLANMSHEIRTPMNAIVGMSHLALKTELTDRQKHYLDTINQSCKSLLAIINDILDFSKIEAGKLHIESIDFLLEDVLTHLADLIRQRSVEKDLELVFRLQPDLPVRLVGDPIRLGQVLLNLAGNAVKFTENGEIIISVRAIEHHDGEVTLEFAVRDTGIGIDAEHLPHLFESFNQGDQSTTRKYGGTGLGLAISQRLVQLMGGEIHAESEPGKGSCFIFTACFGLQAESCDIQAHLHASVRGRRVMVVEDNESMRHSLRDMLATMSFRVTDAGNALEAIDRLTDTDADRRYDLVLLDLHMPDLNGLEVCRLIRDDRRISHKPNILLMSRSDEAIDPESLHELDIDGFLLKPISPSALMDTIVGIFHPRGPVSGSLKLRPDVRALETDTHQARVLLVEDNAINQQVAIEMLTQMGALVTTVNDGAEALDRLRQQAFDIVYMDIQMPVMDGLEATRRIRSELALTELPIVAMTANAMVGDREKSLQAGMNDHINKPIEYDTLHRSLVQWASVKSGPTVESDEALPASTGFLDIDTGVKRLAGNRGLLRKLLQEFHNDHHSDLTLLASAREQKDTETSQRILHTLKGVAGNIGAGALMDAAGALYQEPFSNGDLYETFISRFNEVMQHLHEHFHNDDHAVTEAAKEAESEQLSKYISTFDELLVQGSSRALEQCEELCQRLRQFNVSEDTLESLNNCVSAYDFSTAREILAKLKV